MIDENDGLAEASSESDEIKESPPGWAKEARLNSYRHFSHKKDYAPEGSREEASTASKNK